MSALFHRGEFIIDYTVGDCLLGIAVVMGVIIVALFISWLTLRKEKLNEEK